MHITPLAPFAADKVTDGDVFDLDRLLEQSVEDEAAVAGVAAVEAEGELVEVVVEMLAAGGALVGAEQPAFEQAEMARHVVRALLRIGIALIVALALAAMLVGWCWKPAALRPL